MSDLLKLKFIADCDCCCSRYECYRIQVDKVDDYLLGAVISVVNEKDKNQEYADKVKERMNKVEDWKTQRKVYSFKI